MHDSFRIAADEERQRGLEVWQDFADPDTVCPYPADSHAAKQWQRYPDERPEEFALFRALQARRGGSNRPDANSQHGAAASSGGGRR